MDFTKTHLVLLIVTISMWFAPTTNAIGLAKAIRTPHTRVYLMCKRTTNPPLCFRTILPKALVTPKFNIYKAVEIQIQAISEVVFKTSDIIKTLLPKFTNDKIKFKKLDGCDLLYDSMIGDITGVVTDIARRDLTQARLKLSSVNSYYLSCRDRYVESGTEAPFASDAKLFADLLSNCLGMMISIGDKKLNAGKAPLA